MRLIFGVLLSVALASVLSGCPKKDPAPQIPIGIGDGFGGADFDIPGQPEKEYWPPSKLQNAWITTQDGMAKFASWCYGPGSEEMVKSFLEEKRKAIKGE